MLHRYLAALLLLPASFRVYGSFGRWRKAWRDGGPHLLFRQTLRNGPARIHRGDALPVRLLCYYPLRMAQEMQNLYSKNHINPMSSFIGLFIQFPILIAMYMACQRAEAVAKGSFFGISLEPTPLAGITGGQWVYAVFFLLMLGIQLSSIMIPQWLAKRRAKKEAELHHRPYRPTPNPMGNTMYFMMIFIFVLAINWPTAMTFYWIVSGIVKIVKAVIVDAIANRKKEA